MKVVEYALAEEKDDEREKEVHYAKRFASWPQSTSANILVPCKPLTGLVHLALAVFHQLFDVIVHTPLPCYRDS